MWILLLLTSLPSLPSFHTLISCSSIVVGIIASVHWIDEDGSSTRTFSSTDLEGKGPRPTRILVKLWDIVIFNRLFEVIGVAVARFLPNGQCLAVGRQSENAAELSNLEDGKTTNAISDHFTFCRPVIV